MLYSALVRALLGFVALLSVSPVAAEPHGLNHAGHGHWRDHPNHFSVVSGATFEHGHSAQTIGVDYEHRYSEFLGLGAVLEHARGPIAATTALLVADLHLYGGLILQTGPGFERLPRESTAAGARGKRDSLFVYRVGMLYEFEWGSLTLSPQLHYDRTHRTEAVVAVLALGISY